jgi:hypothetical protein
MSSMDFRFLDAGNPLSEKFRREALQNVSQNISSLRSRKDMENGDADEKAQQDRVDLARGEKSAARPGDTVERPRPADGDARPPRGQTEAGAEAGSSDPAGGRPDAGRARGGQSAAERARAAAQSMADAATDALESGALLSAAGGGGMLEDKDPALRRRKEEEARRLAQEDVPPEILAASRDIVKNQMHPVKGPKPSLREMKNIPEVAALETRPADFAAEMDIAPVAPPMLQEEPDSYPQEEAP